MHRNGLRCVLLFGFLLSAASASAQDDDWTVKSNLALNLTQSSFNNAWAGDEVGTVSWALTSNSEAGKQLAPWANWLNALVLQFGQTHQQDAERRDWQSPRKSTDKITYRGIVRFTYGGYVDPFVALDVDSQFFQRHALGTRLFTPTTVTESAGIARALINTDLRRVVTRLGVASKQRINRLVVDGSGLDFTSETTTEAGIEWFTQGRLATAEERSVLSSELRVFKAFVTSLDGDERMFWASTDVDWQNTLSNKVTKWLSFDLFWQVLFDKQINKVGQYKQTLGVGLTWQLM